MERDVKDDDSKNTLGPESGKTKKKRGAPRKIDAIFTPQVCNLITWMIKEQVSDFQIALALGVSKSSFYRWKEKNLIFWENACVKNQNEDEEIESALRKRAKGFERQMPIYDENGKLVGAKIAYYPPSEAALQYYLNNRLPDRWKSKVEHNHAIEELPLAINFINGPAPKDTRAAPMIDGNDKETSGEPASDGSPIQDTDE